jgi:benzil reductase ((S)-benzoin forming)
MFIITGGSRGIGAALAASLAQAKQTVLIIGRSEATLQAVAEASTHIQCLCADVASKEGRDSIKNHLKNTSKIKGLIHNAGMIEPIQSIKTLPEKAWRDIMTTNLDAPFLLTQALHTQLIGGRVLHIGSAVAYFPVQGWTPYCVSKAGLAMLTQCLQLECPEIATASVMPGIVATHMQATIRASDDQAPDKRQFFQDLKDKQQLITPETVASFLTWLLLKTEQSRYIAKEWDIYDTSHHVEWLKNPHRVPTWD